MKIVLLAVFAATAVLHSIVPSSATVRRSPAPVIAAGSIARAQFTSAIKDRQPADSLTTAGAGAKELYFFTELKGLSGTKVTHRWEHGGKTVLERTFDVGADHWRAWSNKAIAPSAAGEWKVTVVDAGGATLGSYTLTVK